MIRLRMKNQEFWRLFIHSSSLDSSDPYLVDFAATLAFFDLEGPDSWTGWINTTANTKPRNKIGNPRLDETHY